MSLSYLRTGFKLFGALCTHHLTLQCTSVIMVEMLKVQYNTESFQWNRAFHTKYRKVLAGCFWACSDTSRYLKCPLHFLTSLHPKQQLAMHRDVIKCYAHCCWSVWPLERRNPSFWWYEGVWQNYWPVFSWFLQHIADYISFSKDNKQLLQWCTSGGGTSDGETRVLHEAFKLPCWKTVHFLRFQIYTRCI